MKRLALALAIVITMFAAKAQERQRPLDIRSVNVQGFGGVKSVFDKVSNEVICHYAYYQNGFNMEVVFIDTDLKIIERTPLPLATGDIQEAVYNGETILFWTMNEGHAQYYTLDLEGNIIGQFGSEYHWEEDGRTMPDVIPSEIDGHYYILRPWRQTPSIMDAFVGYEIIKVDQNFKTVWSKGVFPEDAQGGIMLQKAESGFDRLVTIESSMRNWLVQNMTGTELICHDSENGDELYRVSLYEDDYTSLPNQISFDEEGNITLGGEYYEDDKIKVTASEGIFVSKLDPSGEEIAQNRSSWKKGIQKQMKRGTIALSGKNKVIFHDLIPSEDGGFQLIGESFSRKQTLGSTSVIGLAAQFTARAVGEYEEEVTAATKLIDVKNLIIALASGRFIGNPFYSVEEAVVASSFFDIGANIRTPTILTVQDLLVFDYDENLELTNVNKIEKAYTNVYAYFPYRSVGGLRLAKIVNNFGFFDYSFSSSSVETGNQLMVYNSMMSKRPHIGIVDIEKGSESIPKPLFIRNLRRYGGFDAEATANDGDTSTRMRYSNAGVAKANDGKVLVYYIEKTAKEQTGTLKIFHETLGEGF